MVVLAFLVLDEKKLPCTCMFDLQVALMIAKSRRFSLPQIRTRSRESPFSFPSVDFLSDQMKIVIVSSKVLV